MNDPTQSACISILVVVVGLAFGAGDQYLGTVHSATALGPWTSSVSALSAPWLVLPFLVGNFQKIPKRAAVAGLAVTLAGLAGYFALTLSPLEGVRFHFGEVAALLQSNERNVIGGLVTGPVFGWLGWRWRVRRDWGAAALIVGALCLEPLAEVAVGHTGDVTVWVAEVFAGAIAAGWFFVRLPRTRRRTI